MSTSSSRSPDPRVVLFRSCRRALGMTLTELQVFLCLRDRVHLYRMEAGTVPIPGPVWVALRDRLRDAGLDYLCSHVEAVLHQMREKVEERNLTMRQQQGQRRREKPGMNGIRGEEG